MNLERDKMFKEHCFNTGKTQKQAQADYDLWNKMVNEQLENADQAKETAFLNAETAFKKNSGLLYDERRQGANDLIMMFTPADAEGKQSEGRANIVQTVKDNPHIASMFADIWDKVKDDTDTQGDLGLNTPGDALTKARELQASEAYVNKDHVSHKDAVAQVESLYKQAFPDGKK